MHSYPLKNGLYTTVAPHVWTAVDLTFVVWCTIPHSTFRRGARVVLIPVFFVIISTPSALYFCSTKCRYHTVLHVSMLCIHSHINQWSSDFFTLALVTWAASRSTKVLIILLLGIVHMCKWKLKTFALILVNKFWHYKFFFGILWFICIVHVCLVYALLTLPNSCCIEGLANVT